MSKTGKQPIIIPEKVEVTIQEDVIMCKGPKGELKIPRLPSVGADMDEGKVQFKLEGESRQAQANFGTMRALVNNAVRGVTEGFQKTLELEGVGYRAAIEGKTLVLTIGFSHPVKINPPEGVTITVEKNTIQVTGIDKNIVGDVAAKIRAVRKVEPYKGKGLKYKGEVVRRKAGKKMAGTTK